MITAGAVRTSSNSSQRSSTLKERNFLTKTFCALPMAEMEGEWPPYQAFGSIAITYSECSTRKEIKHHEHSKYKWFANQHEPAFCRRHSPLDRRRLRSGVVLVVFVDQFGGLKPAVVSNRAIVTAPPLTARAARRTRSRLLPMGILEGR